MNRIRSRVNSSTLALVSRSYQRRLDHFQRPLDRRVRYGVPVMRHDREAELPPVPSVSEPVRVLVPSLTDAQRVEQPGLAADDGLEERLDAGETVGERAEHGRGAIEPL